MSAANAGRWRRDGELPFQKLDEETIVVDPKRREVHLLNETAALGDEYDVDEAELGDAVVECVEGLASKGLVVAAGAR